MCSGLSLGYKLAASAGVEHRRLLQEFRDRGWPLHSRSAAMTHANRKRAAFSDEEARELWRRYDAGESAAALAREAETYPTVVRDAIRRVGGEIRSASDAARRCTLDEHVFDLLTPGSAYWLGMLITDGSVSKARRVGPRGSPTVKLALKRLDRPHIEAFRAFMGSSHKIDDRYVLVRGTKCPTSAIAFASSTLASRLASSWEPP